MAVSLTAPRNTDIDTTERRCVFSSAQHVRKSLNVSLRAYSCLEAWDSNA
jgi:hypothetical protein